MQLAGAFDHHATVVEIAPDLGALLRALGAVPIDRDGESGGGAGGLRAGLAVLERGGCVLLFPEGTRSSDGQVKALEPGLLLFIRRSDAVVMAQPTQRVPKNMIFLPFHFHDCANRLTLGLLDPHSRQPAYKQSAVRIGRIADQQAAARLSMEMRKF